MPIPRAIVVQNVARSYGRRECGISGKEFAQSHRAMWRNTQLFATHGDVLDRLRAPWDSGFISFDHDLGENVPTGHDFAKWLVECHLDGKHLFPETFSYAVHSANPPTVGRSEALHINRSPTGSSRAGQSLSWKAMAVFRPSVFCGIAVMPSLNFASFA
jgi:hypothetical protein